MTRLVTIEGTAVPMPIENLDTDQIMPKQFLRILDKAGLSNGLLYDLRFDESGKVRTDCVLNVPRYREAPVLIGGANFGCGSSREHAVWGLQQYGFQAVIAPSFGEIFYSNAMNNRLLLVQLERSAVNALLDEATAERSSSVCIDIEQQTVTTANGLHFQFPLGSRHKKMVIDGVDTIDLTLKSLPEIEAFEQRYFSRHPWAEVM
jgi:3-isopropylmalate/(R)-2-methylmalate dehydratase small subunit